MILDHLTLVQHLRRAVEEIDLVRSLMEVEDLERDEEIAQRLNGAEAAIRHVLALIAGP